MHRRTLLALLAGSPFARAATRTLDKPFAARLPALMDAAAVPGLVIGTVANGKPAWIQGFGVTRRQDGQPIGATTLFQAASLTKQVTAHIALTLRDQGKLDFTRTLVSYVDDLPDPQARTVTIHHVLSHSSGFPNWRFEPGQPLKPSFPPGTRWQYSGEGYVYLQRLIEHVTAKASPKSPPPSSSNHSE